MRTSLSLTLVGLGSTAPRSGVVAAIARVFELHHPPGGGCAGS